MSSSSGDTNTKNSYTCHSCGLTVDSARTYLHHLVEQHGQVFDIFECDICEYATRCQQNLPRHRKCHFTSDMSPQTDTEILEEDAKMKITATPMNDSESCDTQDMDVESAEQKLESSSPDAGGSKEMGVQSPRGSPVNTDDSDQTKDQLTIRADDTELMKLHKIAMSMKSADAKSPVYRMSTETETTASCITQSPSTEVYLQAASVAAEDKPIDTNTDTQRGEQIMATKPLSKGTLPGASNGVKRRTYTPVREAVDPGKYMIIEEIDGTKYACSKCGNIYKWRKSLNKHWKEKHEGQTPDASIAAAHFGLPSSKMEKKRISASPMHFSSLSTSGGNTKKLATTSSNSRALKQMEFQSHHFGSNNYQPSRHTPVLLSSSVSTSHKRPASLIDAYAAGYIKRACYNRKSPVSSPARSLAASPADMRAMSSGYSIYPDVHTTSPSVVTPKPMYVYHHDGEQMMKSSPPPLLPTPPTAHARYMSTSTLGMLADIPVDLSSRCSSVYSDNSEESVLDLSKDSTSSALKASSLQLPPPQDEPLDFSAKCDPVGVSVKSEDSAAPGQCSVCAYVSKSSADYTEHMAIHNTKSSHRCAACQQHFHSVQDLNDHFQQYHRDVLNAHLTTCRLDCIEGKDDPFAYDDTERTQLFKYLTKKEAEPVPSFCIVCGIKFEGQTSLAVHFQQTHPSLSSPYKSYLSPVPHTRVSVKLETDEAKQQQRQLFDMEQPALLQCSQCTFVARTTSELARHQLKHSLSMTLSCRICATSCQSKNELFLHYQKQHADVSIRHPQDLQLDVHCGLEVDHSEGHDTTAAMDSLTQIVDGDTVIDLTADGTMVVIPQAPEETSSPVHTKPSFGRLSKKYAGLATGNSSASAEMLLPYKCSVCEYRARWPSEITQHMKNHSDEKPYSCPRCTYKSKWKWDVVKHLKRCGGGTVKDVIDNTRRKKLPQMLTMLPEKEHPKLPPEGVGPTNREVLSGGPPNVTVQQKDDSSTPAVLVSEVQSIKETPVASKPEDVAMSPSEKTRQIQSQLYCQKCPFIGNSPAELKRHSRVHSEEKPFICKTCGYCSKWKCDLKKHLRAYNHTPAVPLVYGGHGRKPGEWYNNKLISKTTTPTSSMENSPGTDEGQPIDSHMSSQYLPAMYRCPLCPYITGKRHLLESHTKIHTRAASSGSGKLKCKKCDFEAEDLPGFVQHKITHSTQHSDRYDAAWARAEDMQHGKTQRSNIQQLDGISSGDYMGPSDASSTSDDRHGYSSDTDCESENTASDYRQVSVPHEEHSQQKSVNYRCVHCPYETYNRVDFEKHIPVHVAGDCYQCQWCSWTTSRLNLLYQHAQRSHSLELEAQDKEPRYTEEVETADSKVMLQETCDDKQATDEDNTGGLLQDREGQSDISGISNHEKCTVMKTENGTKRRKMKTCNQCGYITDNLTTLQRHRSKHGCGGKYPCDFCDYSVDRQHVVLYHMRTVHSHIQGVNGGEDMHESGMKPTDDQMRAVKKGAKDGDLEKGLPEGIHVFRQAGKTFYACKKCTYVTGNIGNAQNHAKPHGARKRYTCEHCDYSLDQLRHIIHHMKTFHPQVDDQHQRSKVYHTQARLTASKLRQLAVFQCIPVRVNRKVTYRCLTCAAVSCSKRRILTHITSRHVEVHKHICRHCDYRATTASLQRKHVLKQHAKANSPKGLPAPPPDQSNQLNPDTMKIKNCTICPFQTSSPAELKNHSDFHGMALPFKCDMCNYSHQKLSTVYEHRKLHKNDLSFKTSVPAKQLINTRLFAASKSAEDSKQMSTSIDTDDAIGVTPRGVKYTCSHCPYKCGSLKNYRLHMELHSANRKFQCDYCSWSVDRFNLLYSHRYRLHSSEPNFDLNKDSSELAKSDYQPAMNICPFCPYVSDSSDALSQHQLCHQIKSQHSCDTCSFSVDELSLLQHHQKLHRHVSRNIECGKCPYSTHSHTLLEMHMRMHGADNKFTCELCDYSVSRFNLLSQHKRVHGVKPTRHNNNHRKIPRNRFNSNDRLMVCGGDNEAELLTCDRCPYQACSLTSLAQHSLGHSTKAKHSCPYCDFTSMTILQLAAHINLHFPGTSLDLEEIQQLVKNNSHTDESLVTDMTGQHRDNKPKSDCVCHFCDRSFSDVADLQQHKQMHLIGGGTC